MEKDKEVASLQLSVQYEQKRCADRHSTIINLKQDLRNARIEKEKRLQFLEDELLGVTSRQEDEISVLEERLSNVTSQKDAKFSELEQLAEDNSRLARDNYQLREEKSLLAARMRYLETVSRVHE